jgi:hypothetical protein
VNALTIQEAIEVVNAIGNEGASGPTEDGSMPSGARHLCELLGISPEELWEAAIENARHWGPTSTARGISVTETARQWGPTSTARGISVTETVAGFAAGVKWAQAQRKESAT